MTEREELEREINQLTETVQADWQALRSSSTSDEGRATLLHAIEVRYAELDRLQTRLALLLAA
jgi:hypothetical protein